MQLDSKKVANGLMVDVEIAIGKELPWWLNRKHVQDVMVKVRAIVKPAMERDDCMIRDQAREIICNEERIEELSEAVDQYQSEEEEREGEQEYQELVNLFYTNTLTGKEG